MTEKEVSELRDQNAALVDLVGEWHDLSLQMCLSVGNLPYKSKRILANPSQAAADWRAQVEKPLREALERVTAAAEKLMYLARSGDKNSLGDSCRIVLDPRVLGDENPSLGDVRKLRETLAALKGAQR